MNFRTVRTLTKIGACLSLALVSGAASSEPLPLKPDDGIKSAAHKQFLGKIVFARSAAALAPGREQPSQFVTSFKLSEPIFWRAYAGNSAANRVRLDGKDCGTGGEFGTVRSYDAVVDGKPLGELMAVSARLDEKEYQKTTTWSEERALDAVVADRNEVTVGSQFVDRVASKLTPGTHRIVISVGVKCVGQSFLSKPMATGEITLQVTAADIAALTAPTGKMPKPARNDAALAAKGTAIMNAEWKSGGSSRKALKTVITEKDWSVERNELTGIIVSRSIDTTVAYQDNEGCHIYTVRFRQDAQGNGTFGPSYLGSEGMDDEDIDCKRVK